MHVYTYTQDPHLDQYWRQALPASIPLDRLPTASEGWEARPAVLVVDMSCPQLPELDAAGWSALTRRYTVIAADSAPENDRGLHVMAGGCRGYCHAYLDAASWRNALQVAQAGGVWLGASLMQQLLDQTRLRIAPQPSAWRQGLSEREVEVAEGVAAGLANRDLAERLGIGERTVKSHLTAIYDKLAINDRLQLALKVLGRL